MPKKVAKQDHGKSIDDLRSRLLFEELWWNSAPELLEFGQLDSPRWQRDLAVENLLNLLNIQWRLAIFPVDRFDQEAGWKMQAREGEIIEELGLEYAMDMADGHYKFPAGVGRFDGPFKIVPLGGNHRLYGALYAKWPDMAAYIVENLNDPGALITLPKQLNLLPGVRLGAKPDIDRRERLTHAVNWVNQYGGNGESRDKAIERAAKDLKVSKTAIHRRLREIQTRQRLAGLGQDDSKLSQAQLNALSTIKHDSVFARASCFVRLKQMNPDQVSDLIKAAARAGNREEEQLCGVEDYMTEVYGDAKDIPRGAPVKAPAMTRFRAWCSAFDNLITMPGGGIATTVQEMGITQPEHVNEALAKITRVVSACQSIRSNAASNGKAHNN